MNDIHDSQNKEYIGDDMHDPIDLIFVIAQKDDIYNDRDDEGSVKDDDDMIKITCNQRKMLD